MKKFYALSFALAAVLSFTTHNYTNTVPQGNTWRFCNVGTTPLTVGPDYWVVSNPASVTIQPGQSYDYSTYAALKGFCSSTNPNDVSTCDSGSSYFHRDSHSNSMTFMLNQASPTTINYTKTYGAVSCSTPGS